MSAEDINIVRKIYEIGSTGNIGGALTHIHPEVTVYKPESLGGAMRGHEGFLNNLMGMLGDGGDTVEITPDKFLDAEEFVVVLVQVKWHDHQTNQKLQMPTAQFWKLVQGKVTELYLFYWDTNAMARIQV